MAAIELSDIEQAVVKLAERVAEYEEVEVVGVNLFGGRKRVLLRVTIDKNDGVTLDDCEKFSRSLGSLLETEDIIKDGYTLEVSSPGLDRPLNSIRDFKRNTGKLARVVTKEKIDNRNFFIGRIMGVEGESVKLFVDKKEIDISFDEISKARLEIEI